MSLSKYSSLSFPPRVCKQAKKSAVFKGGFGICGCWDLPSKGIARFLRSGSTKSSTFAYFDRFSLLLCCTYFICVDLNLAEAELVEEPEPIVDEVQAEPATEKDEL